MPQTPCTISSTPLPGSPNDDAVCGDCEARNFAVEHVRHPPDPWGIEARLPLAPCRDGRRVLARATETPHG